MISREDIEGLAKLARLSLSDKEKEVLKNDVSNILEYIGQVTAVVGDGFGPIAPLHHNSMREDIPRADKDQLTGKEEAIRAQFPKRDSNYNVVRKIIQKEE